MPRYDIQCVSCTYLFEVQRGMNQDNPPCPQCGSTQVTQLPSQTSFALTSGGVGWARNGYSKGTK